MFRKLFTKKPDKPSDRRHRTHRQRADQREYEAQSSRSQRARPRYEYKWSHARVRDTRMDTSQSTSVQRHSVQRSQPKSVVEQHPLPLDGSATAASSTAQSESALKLCFKPAVGFGPLDKVSFATLERLHIEPQPSFSSPDVIVVNIAGMSYRLITMPEANAFIHRMFSAHPNIAPITTPVVTDLPYYFNLSQGASTLSDQSASFVGVLAARTGRANVGQLFGQTLNPARKPQSHRSRHAETGSGPRDDTTLPSEGACQRIAVNMLHALRALHSAGYVHLSFSPSTVLATRDGRYQLSDFARVQPMGSTVSPSLLAVNCQYIAPEVLSGEPVTGKADILSLGRLLFCLLTGKTPFSTVDTCGPACLTAPSVLKLVKGAMDLSPATMRHLSPPCRDLIRRMCHPDPDARPSAEEALHHPWLRTESLSTSSQHNSFMRQLNLWKKPLEQLSRVLANADKIKRKDAKAALLKSDYENIASLQRAAALGLHDPFPPVAASKLALEGHVRC